MKLLIINSAKTNMRNIEKIRALVKDESSEWDWTWHVTYVVRNAKFLAHERGIDEELAELAALLHDIGRIRHGPESHEKTGANDAEKILRDFEYPEKIIMEVRHCIESHRSSTGKMPNTLLAKIIANADAMAHFQTVPALFQIALKKEKNSIYKARHWVYEKLKRDWNKLTLPEAKKRVKKQYDAALVLFSPLN